MLRRLLVPVDFSPCARAALEYAALLGDRFRSEVHLLHVWEPHRSREDRELAALGLSSSTEAGRKLDAWLRFISPACEDRVGGRLEVGDPFTRILEAAPDYDLIVMGTNGRTGVAHMLRGSLAEKVVRKAGCPVLTIRVAEKVATDSAWVPLFAGELA